MNRLKKSQRGVRILGRQVGETLSTEELKLVSGGPYEGDSAATDSHSGTCTSEQDCD